MFGHDGRHVGMMMLDRDDPAEPHGLRHPSREVPWMEVTYRDLRAHAEEAAQPGQRLLEVLQRLERLQVADMLAG